MTGEPGVGEGVLVAEAAAEPQSLRSKAVAATTWSGIDLVLRQGVQFGVSVALARLLTPADFGTVALIYLFTGIASLFVDTGFSAAIVQRQNVTADDVSSVFWFNVGSGLVMTLGLCAASPAIAAFYGVPILVPLTCVMGANLFLSALSSVHLTLLTKALDFKTQAKVGFSSTLVSGAAAVYLAWRGAGVWALAVQAVLASLTTALLLWALHGWRPERRFRLDSLKSLFRYSGPLFAYFSLDMIYSRLYSVLIGKLYSPADLGLYARADGTQKLPSGLLVGIIHRASFPIFASVAQDAERLKKGLKMAMGGVMFLNAPAMLGIIATARPLVLTLFGPRWLPSVAPLQILCVAGLFLPLHALNSSVLMARGDSGLLLRTDIATRAVGIVAVIIASLFGMVAIAWATVLFTVVGFFIKAHYLGRQLGYSAPRQLWDIGPIFVVSSVMAVPVWMIQGAVQAPAWLVLAAQVASGVVIYVGVGKLLRLEVLDQAWSSALALAKKAAS